MIGYDKTFKTDKNGEILIEKLQVYDSQNRLITYKVEEVDTPIRYEAVAAQMLNAQQEFGKAEAYLDILKIASEETC